METMFKITGKVISFNGLPLEQVYVSVNDKDQFMDDCLGRATTNEAGEFVLCFGQGLFNQDLLEFEQIPDLYLMFFVQEDGRSRLISQKNILGAHFKEGILDLGCISIVEKK